MCLILNKIVKTIHGEIVNKKYWNDVKFELVKMYKNLTNLRGIEHFGSSQIV